MQATLPDSPNLKIQQSTERLTQARLAGCEQIAVVLPRNPPAAVWRQLPYGNLLKKLLRRQGGEHRTPALTACLPNTTQTGVSLDLLKPAASAFERLTHARKIVGECCRGNPASLGLLVVGFEDPGPVIEALVSATLAAAFQLPRYKSKTPAAPRLRTVRVLGLDKRLDLKRVQAEAEGNNLARWLTSLPPNALTPGAYRSRVESLAKTVGWQAEFLDENRLRRKGAGAFLAVAQGSPDRDAGILHLKYRPGPKTKKSPDLCLIGKGVCFDTGGTNLKPFKSMLEMHEDMQGSAVALGTLLALTRLEVDFDVDCWLALTENRIGGSAYKSQDIVTAVNGTTIQVIHTDAEGRMALADTLALAGATKPRVIVDFATLTGACIAALTRRYSGVFSNRPDWYPMLKSTGVDSGERVWPFPMDDDYDVEIESPVADVMQCPTGNDGDHIYAARFLHRFVPKDTPWIHVDLAAGHSKGGLAHIPTNITGFGVRYAVSLAVDRHIHAQEKG